MNNSMDWLINLVFRIIDLAREKELSPWETGIAIVSILFGAIAFFNIKHKKQVNTKVAVTAKGKHETRTAKKGIKNQESKSKTTTLAKKSQPGSVKKRGKTEKPENNNITSTKKDKEVATTKKKPENNNITSTKKVKEVATTKKKPENNNIISIKKVIEATTKRVQSKSNAKEVTGVKGNTKVTTANVDARAVTWVLSACSKIFNCARTQENTN